RAGPFLFHLCVSFLCLTALPQIARAQSDSGEKEPSPAAANAPSLAELCQKPQKREGAPDKNAQKLSRNFLAQAKKTYDDNNYVEAARALRSAFEALPQIETLFNLAQTCREGGANREALALYQTLLAAEPEEHIES